MTFTIVGGHRRPRAVTGLLVVFALLTTGCYKATGGGWIPTAPFYMTGGDRASFGFTARCQNAQQNGMPVAKLYDGQLEWHDGSVSFHGNVESLEDFNLQGRCEDLRQDALFGSGQTFGGTYQPQNGGEAGIFLVQVDDLGEPGRINGDSIIIQVIDGLYAGYINGGTIEGGNIQVF